MWELWQSLPDTSGAGVETTDPDALLESLVAQALQETAPEALVPEALVPYMGGIEVLRA